MKAGLGEVLSLPPLGQLGQQLVVPKGFATRESLGVWQVRTDGVAGEEVVYDYVLAKNGQHK